MLPAEYYSIAWKGVTSPVLESDAEYWAMHKDGGQPVRVSKELCDEINERNALLTEIEFIEKNNLLNFSRPDLK